MQGTNIVIRLREANTIVNNIGQPFADIGTDFVAAGTITFTGAISTTGSGTFAYASDLGNNVAALDAAGGQLFIPTEPNAIVDSFFDPATLTPDCSCWTCGRRAARGHRPCSRRRSRVCRTKAA